MYLPLVSIVKKRIKQYFYLNQYILQIYKSWIWLWSKGIRLLMIRINWYYTIADSYFIGIQKTYLKIKHQQNVDQ